MDRVQAEFQFRNAQKLDLDIGYGGRVRKGGISGFACTKSMHKFLVSPVEFLEGRKRDHRLCILYFGVVV